MSRKPDPRTKEERQSLWWLAVGPSVWAVHFLLCYITAAIWIEKDAGRDASLAPIRIVIAIYTVMALAAIVWIFIHGYRRHNYGTAAAPHDFDTADDRHRFLGFATLLLSGLSGVATIFTAIVAFILKTTH